VPQGLSVALFPEITTDTLIPRTDREGHIWAGGRPSATWPTIDCEEQWRVASGEKTKSGGERERRAGPFEAEGKPKPGLYNVTRQELG